VKRLGLISKSNFPLFWTQELTNLKKDLFVLGQSPAAVLSVLKDSTNTCFDQTNGCNLEDAQQKVTLSNRRMDSNLLFWNVKKIVYLFPSPKTFYFLQEWILTCLFWWY